MFVVDFWLVDFAFFCLARLVAMSLAGLVGGLFLEVFLVDFFCDCGVRLCGDGLCVARFSFICTSCVGGFHILLFRFCFIVFGVFRYFSVAKPRFVKLSLFLCLTIF